MAYIGVAHLIGLAVANFMASVKPELSLVRSFYWYRIPTRTRSTMLERIPVAIIGMLLLAAAVWSFSVIVQRAQVMNWGGQPLASLMRPVHEELHAARAETLHTCHEDPLKTRCRN
jgi:hypothetical protein